MSPARSPFTANQWAKRSSVFAAITFFAAASIHAQESADLTKLKELSLEQIINIQVPTVYGASKHEQKITSAPSAVTIITRDEIRAYGHRTLADVLQSARDFYVTNDRNYSYVGVRGFNRPGDYGGRILVLVDDHRLNDPVYESIGIGHEFPIDIDLIDRVEIIRGPGSSLYGTNAFFAVINVVTRKASDLNGAEASASYGSFNSSKARFSYGKAYKNGLSLLLSGSAYNSDGNDLYFREFDQPENNRGRANGLDDERAFNLSGTLSYGDFSFQSAYSWRRKQVPTAAFGTVFGDPRFHTVDERFYARLHYRHEFENDWTVSAALSYDAYRYHGEYPYPDASLPAGSYIFRDAVDAGWWSGEFQISKKLLDRHRLTLGGEYRDHSRVAFKSYNIDPYERILAINRPSQTSGVFLQDEWSPAKWITVNAGIRYDWFSLFDSALNPRVGVILEPARDTTIKLLYGEAFRAPNAYESSYVSPEFKLNPDLAPEEIRSYEVVLEQGLGNHLRLSATGFYNQISGLITETYNPATQLTTYLNGESAETKGASFELEAKLKNGVRGRASYTVQRTTDAASGRELSNSPRHLAKLNLAVPLYRDKVFAGLETQYTSEVTNARGTPIGDSFLVNCVLTTRELVPGLETSIGVYNVFGQRYSNAVDPALLQESIPQDGRTFRLKFDYRF